jgi:hypothetical protein
VFDNPIHDADVFGETAAGRLESGGTANFLVSGALREGLIPAVKALPAWDVMEDDDTVSGAVLADILANSGDNAGSFVSEDARGGVRSGGDFLQVGAADATGVDADQYFALADSRDGDDL